MNGLTKWFFELFGNVFLRERSWESVIENRILILFASVFDIDNSLI